MAAEGWWGGIMVNAIADVLANGCEMQGEADPYRETVQRQRSRLYLVSIIVKMVAYDHITVAFLSHASTSPKQLCVIMQGDAPDAEAWLVNLSWLTS